MRFTSLIVAAICVLTPAQSRAQSVAGTWDAAMSTPGGVVTFGLRLQVHGDTVTGTVQRSAGDVPLSGTVIADTISFSYVVSYNDHPLTLTMVARVVGDSMLGTVDFAGQGSDSFWAHRTKAAPPDSGAHRTLATASFFDRPARRP